MTQQPLCHCSKCGWTELELNSGVPHTAVAFVCPGCGVRHVLKGEKWSVGRIEQRADGRYHFGSSLYGHELDRSKWDRGYMVDQDEPDAVEFSAHGMKCLINRNTFGSLCGYVDLPPGHPDFGGYPSNYEIHGGSTYGTEAQAPGVKDTGDWRIGFDCDHSCDTAPGGSHDWGGSYKDLRYVRAETESLAKQAAERATLPKESK